MLIFNEIDLKQHDEEQKNKHIHLFHMHASNSDTILTHSILSNNKKKIMMGTLSCDGTDFQFKAMEGLISV